MWFICWPQYCSYQNTYDSDACYHKLQCLKQRARSIPLSVAGSSSPTASFWPVCKDKTHCCCLTLPVSIFGVWSIIHIHINRLKYPSVSLSVPVQILEHYFCELTQLSSKALICSVHTWWEANQNLFIKSLKGFCGPGWTATCQQWRYLTQPRSSHPVSSFHGPSVEQTCAANCFPYHQKSQGGMELIPTANSASGALTWSLWRRKWGNLVYIEIAGMPCSLVLCTQI